MIQTPWKYLSCTKSISADVFCSYLTAPDKTTVSSNKDSVRDWTGLPPEMVAAPSLDTFVTRMSNLHLWIHSFQRFHYPTIHPPLDISPPPPPPPPQEPVPALLEHVKLLGKQKQNLHLWIRLRPFFFSFLFFNPLYISHHLQIFCLSSLALSQLLSKD